MGRWERGGIVDNDFKWIVGPKIGPPPMPNDLGKITFSKRNRRSYIYKKIKDKLKFSTTKWECVLRGSFPTHFVNSVNDSLSSPCSPPPSPSV